MMRDQEIIVDDEITLDETDDGITTDNEIASNALKVEFCAGLFLDENKPSQPP